jgi:tRNA modification GTPase
MADDTIVAISTPPGRSGIGIVRSSGPKVGDIVVSIAGCLPPPRHARLSAFKSREGEVIDEGILLYFPAPRSFTGETMAEFHTHGGQVILQSLFETVCACGARPARPGEFSERAFRNSKIDLAQAEAIADLIDSRTARAARSAMRTMRGEFSAKTNALIDRLHLARAELEASIDFPDDIGPADRFDAQFAEITAIRTALCAMSAAGRQGARLNSGAAVAIAGAPNVGKSTLMNVLAREDKAIVSDIPGTTRDVIEADTVIRDIPVRLYDTAGLRTTTDPVEREGVDRAARAMQDADVLLLVTDDPAVTAPERMFTGIDVPITSGRPVLVIHNKIDLHGLDAGVDTIGGTTHVFVSALKVSGLDHLTAALAGHLGVEDLEENEFVARERHLAALGAASRELDAVQPSMLSDSPELVAECYRRAARSLGEISGAYSTEDLLGEIFARFCIGK